MLEPFVELLLSLRASLCDTGFLSITLAASLALCFWGIPWVTDIMVDSVSGLAGKHFGPKKRTLAINASTNTPELFLMLVSLAILKVGGVATPLGSNFANLYLMFLLAPLWVIVAWTLKGKAGKAKDFLALLKKEKGLLFWHLGLSTMLFTAASFAFWCLTGELPIGGGGKEVAENNSEPGVRGLSWLLIGAAVCSLAVFIASIFDRRLKASRPKLFTDIDNSEENASWRNFLLSMAGLIFCSLFMNVVFLAWTDAYGETLQGILGKGVFTGIHFFAGALVTSLPEISVALANYRRLRSPDLNTALSSATYSNFSNLAIAAGGCLLAALLIALGVQVTN